MKSPRPAVPSSLNLPLAIAGGWLLFSAMVIAISWAGQVLRGMPFDLAGLLIWNLGWVYWIGGTFVVAGLARRLPLERGRLPAGIALHAGLGILTGVALLALEFATNLAIKALWPGAPRSNAFIGLIAYKFHVYFLIYWMIVGATRAFDAYTRLRESQRLAAELETQLARAQFQALQAQLQPHFLFNTHHAIVSLMLKHDNAAAIRMLTRLSDLLRLTLRGATQQVTSLQEELAALDLYLGIQRERFRDRLETQLEIAPEALPAEVPWLLLQPLVENALHHGIEPRAEGGKLRVTARVHAGELQLTVSDDGPGFPAGFDLENARGIGLRNTRARLARLYGAAQRFELARAPEGGAEIRLTLPHRVPLAPAGEPAAAHA